MIHTSLISHYEKMFALKQYHQWTITELEELIPWELDVYVTFLNNYIELQDMKRKQAEVNR